MVHCCVSKIGTQQIRNINGWQKVMNEWHKINEDFNFVVIIRVSIKHSTMYSLLPWYVAFIFGEVLSSGNLWVESKLDKGKKNIQWNENLTIHQISINKKNSHCRHQHPTVSNVAGWSRCAVLSSRLQTYNCLVRCDPSERLLGPHIIFLEIRNWISYSISGTRNTMT